MSEELTPITRTENFLARIAGDDAPELEPITRIEHFLQEIIDNGSGGGGGTVEEVTVETAGAVTQALDAGKIYHFTGALTSLTITLTAPASGLAQYHFDFNSGSTAPTLTMPGTVTMPDDFSVEASTHYEVDVLNGYGTVVSWANS